MNWPWTRRPFDGRHVEGGSAVKMRIGVVAGHEDNSDVGLLALPASHFLSRHRQPTLTFCGNSQESLILDSSEQMQVVAPMVFILNGETSAC